MENASKALIIAGAILISILLISIGIIIMNSSERVTGEATKSAESMAIQTFNGQFSGYLGDGISASQIRALISAVNASNASNDTKVTLSGFVTGNTTDGFVASGVVTNQKYKVNVTKYTSGYYDIITISV